MGSQTTRKPLAAGRKTAIKVDTDSFNVATLLDEWASDDSDSDKENGASSRPVPPSGVKQQQRGVHLTKSPGSLKAIQSNSTLTAITSVKAKAEPLTDIVDQLNNLSISVPLKVISKVTTTSSIPRIPSASPPKAIKAGRPSPPSRTPARKGYTFPSGSSTSPLFLPDHSDSESEPESVVLPKRVVGKSRRIIRDPDSDSGSEAETSRHGQRHSGAANPSQLSSRQITARLTETLTRRSMETGALKVKARITRREVSKYLDISAAAPDYESEEDESTDGETRMERDKKWQRKYYDESLGSLRDFIVNDDYVSEVSDEEKQINDVESSEEEVIPLPPKRTKKKAVKVKTPPRGAREKVVIDITTPDTDEDVRIAEVDEEGSSNGDILRYSPPPRKLLTLPNLDTLTIIDDSDSDLVESSPPALTPANGGPATPARSSAAARTRVPPTPKTPASKKAWAIERVRVAQGIFDELDRKVFENKLGKAGAGTVLEWNNRLLTTAGQAHSKRQSQRDGSKTEEVKIILSEKVLTGKDQILATVAHEMCHVASWVISNERKNPHGRIFKGWGRKVMRARPDIEVTTKHDYVIEYKFEWKCSNEACGKMRSYKRHSKSIDVEKQACGRCRGKLEPLFGSKKETGFQLYLKENMSLAKTAMSGAAHGDVMRALSHQWTEAGPEADHNAHWRSLAAAAKS